VAGTNLLDDLADRILDGATVDWTAAESSVDPETRRLLEPLRLVARVAAAHRSREFLSHSTLTDGSMLASTLTAPANDPTERLVRWGHLRVLARIASGTFGDVYRAWDTRLDREVALKVLPAPATRHARTSSIIEEGRLLARVRHPNVVTIYGAEQIGEQVGLWMEFIPGRTLEQLIAEGKRFSDGEVTRIGIALGRAVTAVHGAGLIHRDIKAHNVMLANDGHVVLMDFGSGREQSERFDEGPVGTPLYMAPELLRDGTATVQSDVYTVGVLLYHLLTGSYPVAGRNLAELRRAHARTERTDVQVVRPETSPGLANVIRRATEADPEHRYRSAEELTNALSALESPSDTTLITTSTNWTKRLGLVAAVALLAFVSSSGPGSVRPEQTLGAREWLLVGTFSGAGADRDLPATLQQAVTAEFEQSPHLNVFPISRVREALDRMQLPAETPIDLSVGLELCAREGLAALVGGSVEHVGDEYVVRLRVTHAGTQSVLASAQLRRRAPEDALEAVLLMARQLRQQLGESLASVQATSPPLEPVTSHSFEAVRRFTLGKRLYELERPREALPHFLQAIELDPAMAAAHEYAAHSYGYLGEHERQRQYLDIAANLASDAGASVGQIERERILAAQNAFLERYEQAAAHWRSLLTLRPTDGHALRNLGAVFGSIRQYGDSIKALEAARQVDPHPRIRWMLADMYSAAGQPEAAVQLLREHLNQTQDWIVYAKHLSIAGRRSDAETALIEAERQTHQTANASWADLSLVRADVYRSEGRYREAEDALQQGLDRGGPFGIERLELAMASLLLDSGRKEAALARLRTLDVQLARNRILYGVLLVRAGDLPTAGIVLNHLEREAADRRSPRPESRVHQLRAEVALAAGRAAEAHALAARAVRANGSSWTLETLARAQQAAGHIPEAIATWTTILERPGERAIEVDAPAVSKVVLASYEVARLLERNGQIAAARVRSQEFLQRWERADPDLTVLVDTRARLRRLGQGAQATPSGRAPKPAT
jgi:serine/threonine-protein kinase